MSEPEVVVGQHQHFETLAICTEHAITARHCSPHDVMKTGSDSFTIGNRRKF